MFPLEKVSLTLKYDLSKLCHIPADVESKSCRDSVGPVGTIESFRENLSPLGTHIQVLFSGPLSP